jgi:Tfp pilus assembly protein PilF
MAMLICGPNWDGYIWSGLIHKEAMIGIATLSLRTGEDKRAKYYLKKLIKQDPGNLTVISLLAQAQNK